ncbi:hypothetical protein QJS10_CPB12g00664 [Acorus calamus]|uniref:Endonuclease/exonuclease/phosphatase domain-containing protein n=1 Tax=Acorus calamus TaxID=4465 RepID=A0AAV9DN29_ACOCL|nr:hypothetical protein QJS10_CPB12g00664 [Acorus calamus]
MGNFSLWVLLEDKRTGGRWCCSNVYGPKDDAGRGTLWEELSAIRAHGNAPVAIMGDFNVIRRPGERNRTNQLSPAMTNFSYWIEEEGLVDLPIANQQFTWSNMREVSSLVRLRVLIDERMGRSILMLPRVVLTISRSSLNRRCANSWNSSASG